jgi:hypothetical protein
VHLIPRTLRRRLKRRRFARTWRKMEAFTYQCAPTPTWSRVRRLNDVAHVWERRPER